MAVGAYSMPTRYASNGHAYYTVPTPQGAATALTAAMVQAAQPGCAMPSAAQMATFQQQGFKSVQQCMPNFSQQMPSSQWVTPQFQKPPASPPSLTEGMADPAAIDKQKASYVKTLEEQRQHYIKQLDDQKKEYLASIHAQAEQLKKQMLMQLDQQVKDQVLALENKYNEQVNTLDQQLHQQRSALEQEAIKLKGEYQQKHLEEQAMQRQFQLQKECVEMEQKYAADMQALKEQQLKLAEQTGMYSSHGTASYGVQPGGNQGTGSYVPPLTMPGVGSYVPPETGAAPYGMPTASGGSYVPPITMQAHPSVPMPSATGSYVPPVTFMEPQVSYHEAYAQPAAGSYVPPATGSYVPPSSMVTTEQVPQTQHGSYVPSPASAELLRCAGASAVTQPQVTAYGPKSQQSQFMTHSAPGAGHSNAPPGPAGTWE